MKRNPFVFLWVVTWLAILARSTSLAQNDDRAWDQEKAKVVVDRVLRTEKRGLKWDRIPWITDVDLATSTAAEQQKPILVYWFVKKGGPAKAPC